MAVEAYFGYATSFRLTDKDGDSLRLTLRYDSDDDRRAVDTGTHVVTLPMALMTLEYTDEGENGTFCTADDLRKLSKFIGGVADAMEISENMVITEKSVTRRRSTTTTRRRK